MVCGSIDGTGNRDREFIRSLQPPWTRYHLHLTFLLTNLLSASTSPKARPLFNDRTSRNYSPFPLRFLIQSLPAPVFYFDPLQDRASTAESDPDWHDDYPNGRYPGKQSPNPLDIRLFCRISLGQLLPGDSPVCSCGRTVQGAL